VEIARQVMNTPPPDIREYVPDAPLPVVDALQRGMAADPADRPKTATALIQQIERAYRAEVEDATDATAALPPAPPDLSDYRASRAARALAGPEPSSTSAGPQPVPPPKRDALPRSQRRRWQHPAPRKRRGLPPGVFGLLILIVVGIAVGTAISASKDDEKGGDSSTTATTPPTDNGGSSTETTPTTPPEDDPEDAPAAAVRAFYEDAAKDDYDAAWELAGPGVRLQLGGRAEFEETFTTLEKIEFTKLAIASQSDIAAVVNVETVATHTDRVDRCTGNVQLTNDGKNGWKLQRLNIASCDQDSPGASADDPIPEGKGPAGGKPVDPGNGPKPKKPKKDKD
jgi:hypothetical protein